MNRDWLIIPRQSNLGSRSYSTLIPINHYDCIIMILASSQDKDIADFYDVYTESRNAE